MKNRSVLWIVLILAAFCFWGCSTTPKPPKPPAIMDIPYTFLENETADGTATIVFTNRIWLVDVEGEQLPAPAEGTRWNPLRFPAGREFNVRVYVLYHSNQPGYRRRGIFICPPLEADKQYKLWYEAAKTKYYSGAGRLILTYYNVKQLSYFLGLPKYKQIHVQQIPPL